MLEDYSVNNDLNAALAAPCKDFIYIDLNYKAGTSISIFVFNAVTNQIFNKTDLIIGKQDKTLPFYIKTFKEKQITRLEVKMTDHKRRSSTNQVFEL